LWVDVKRHTGYAAGMNAADCERWVEMDRLLCERGWGLNVERFAEQWSISERQVKRDLAELRKLGQATVLWQPGGSSGEIREYCHRYAEGIEPLFTRNKLL